MVRPKATDMKIFDGQKFEWRSLPILEEGEPEKLNFYHGSSAGQSDSRIVQVNRYHLFVLGGSQGYPSLLTRDYDVPRSCIRVDLNGGKAKQMRNMLSERLLFSVCVIGHKIYVIGGRNDKGTLVKVTDYYDIIRDRWHRLPEICDPDVYCHGMTVE